MDEDWDPALYDRFRAERTRPFEDLLALLPPAILGRMIDLGCGDGRGTAKAAERLGVAAARGVDTSPAMLERARRRPGAIDWLQADIAEVVREGGRPWDLVLSNAALHWLPDHEGLFPALLDRVAPGGWLAVQMPFNHREPTHALLETVARELRFARAFEDWTRDYPLLEPGRYAELLAAAGFRHRVVELRTYRHPVPGPAAIASFTRASAMRPYLTRLSTPGEEEAFVERYTALLDEAYPACDGSGTRLLDYRRLLMVGRRPPP